MKRLRWLDVYCLLGIMWSIAVPTPSSLYAQHETTEEEPAAGSESSKEESAEKDADEYYQLFSMLADAIAQVEENYVKPIDRREIFAAAVRGVMQELDPYSNFISPEELDDFRVDMESNFGGLGMQVSVDGRGRLMVISPLVGTPAYDAGIRAGDRIVEIDGESTEELPLSEAVKRMKGPIGTAVQITIRRVGQREPVELKLTRERIHVDTVLGYQRDDDDRWEFMAERGPKIGYVRLTAFSRETADELKRALTKLVVDGMQGLVIDLRFNPGGLLTSAVEVADLFVSDGLIVATDGRNIRRREWNAHRSGTMDDVPMVVLVNRFSASASEVVSACLQDHHRAIVIGERTWGKGSVQNVVELDGGQGALKLTTASYHRPSGKNIHRFAGASDSDEWGVKPDEGYEVRLSLAEMGRLIELQRQQDVILPRDSAGETAESETDENSDPAEPFVDRQLERALEYLRGVIAADNPALQKAS